jgi:hypothetical protein
MAIKPSEAYVRFDEFEDVLASVELVALLAPFVREDPRYCEVDHRRRSQRAARCDGLRLCGHQWNINPEEAKEVPREKV